ncbi:hypothetical protein E0Z10_g3343 [Xylaria hypoxylon]|uniref:Cutinase n=1 Tax=Xylaria hypoxylon TaxID=37992 RepID=A0A4Z0YNB5_9PEZI|nr:hypothetical protein E0Z10_g3343 [Xylaria hypoxylon]
MSQPTLWDYWVEKKKCDLERTKEGSASYSLTVQDTQINKDAIELRFPSSSALLTSALLTTPLVFADARPEAATGWSSTGVALQRGLESLLEYRMAPPPRFGVVRYAKCVGSKTLVEYLSPSSILEVVSIRLCLISTLVVFLNMKFSSFLSAALAVAVTAGPVRLDFAEDIVLSSRATGTTANDYLNGGCKDVILFYARGSNQAGNLGERPGPQTADGLIEALGTAKIAIQGVTYSAALLNNVLSGGCDPAEAKDFATLLSGAATSCPSSKLVVSGYSQGAALIHAAVEQLTTAARARIFAAVTYGDTQNKQDGGMIPSFDTSKTLILCNTGDRLCEGTLIVTSAHLDYTPSVPTGVSFIISKLG